MNQPAIFQRSKSLLLALLLVAAGISGCASYVTPGPGAKLAELSQSDWDIEKLMSRKPAAQFPARIAMVRVQGAGYKSYGNAGYGTGRYSVVTTRDIEEEKHFERVKNLPLVAGVASINRLLLPTELDTDRPLRQAAASLQADMLLLYTLDTSFRIDETNLGPFFSCHSGFPAEQGSDRHGDRIRGLVRCSHRLRLRAGGVHGARAPAREFMDDAKRHRSLTAGSREKVV